MGVDTVSLSHGFAWYHVTQTPPPSSSPTNPTGIFLAPWGGLSVCFFFCN